MEAISTTRISDPPPAPTPERAQLNGLYDALGRDAFRLIATRRAAVDALCALRARHQALWALEDRARSRRATDSEIAEIKRGIDLNNGARHKTIDLVDQALAPTVAASESARCSSETIGELCDRLIILGLKITNTQALASDPTIPTAECTRCAQTLTRQTTWRSHLHACLRDLVTGLANGTVILPPRSEFKLYNEKLLNPVTRQEGETTDHDDDYETRDTTQRGLARRGQ